MAPGAVLKKLGQYASIFKAALTAYVSRAPSKWCTLQPYSCWAEGTARPQHDLTPSWQFHSATPAMPAGRCVAACRVRKACTVGVVTSVAQVC
jgi:hypothetical protein